MVVARILVGLAGGFVVAGTVGSAVRTVVLPRAVSAKIAGLVFIAMRLLFRLRAGPRAPYERIDRVMAFYGPASLLTLLFTWLALVLGGFTAIFWALGVRPLRESFILSGSSLLTLGFSRAQGLPSTALSFTEAAIGLVLLALLITYLPSIYSAFSRREAAVGLLEVRAGSPNTPASTFEMIRRAWSIHGFSTLPQFGQHWERWFIDIEESHTSFPSLPFFRSPTSDRSWIVAAGTVLDASSILMSSVEGGKQPDVQFCIRAGFLALRGIATSFGIPHDDDPRPDDPISVSRAEFERMLDDLAAAGVPILPDRDQAWRDFAGWRVNYDTVLLALAALTLAPEAPWISDRSPPLVGASRTMIKRLSR